MKKGNKENATLNGEWAKHVRKDGKKITSGKRRMASKETTKKEMKHLESFNNFSVNEDNIFKKWVSGHESDADRDAAKDKFLKAIGDAELSMQKNPENYAQSKNWEVVKKDLLEKAKDNNYRGGLRIQKGRLDKRVFIIYDEKSSGFQELVGAASSSVNSRQSPR